MTNFRFAISSTLACSRPSVSGDDRKSEQSNDNDRERRTRYNYTEKEVCGKEIRGLDFCPEEQVTTFETVSTVLLGSTSRFLHTIMELNYIDLNLFSLSFTVPEANFQLKRLVFFVEYMFNMSSFKTIVVLMSCLSMVLPGLGFSQQLGVRRGHFTN